MKTEVESAKPEGADADALVEFDAVAWESGGAGSRSKTIVRGAQRIRLLELTRGFSEPQWCTHGHAGRVLEGSLTLRTRLGSQPLRRDDVFVIEPGDGHAHKAEIDDDGRALLLLFETVEH
jgi:quercetin dioxygenase-like cupin family protein